MTQGNQVWKVVPGVRFRRLLDEAVLTSPHHSESFVLNDTAANFVECLDGKRTVDEIAVDMASRFEVSVEQLALDLTPFIKQLAAEGVIDTV